MTIPAYPLQWPAGWKRTEAGKRTRAKFGRQTQSYGSSYKTREGLTIAQATTRVRDELQRMGVRDLVISTDLELRLDGLPRSGQRQPADPGAAVYWRERGQDTPRCMAIDRYDRIEDNLAAIAATLDAMRAIERHGGAAILDRAFTGFTALPAPTSATPWHVVLGCPAHASTEHVRTNYRKARSLFHPDKGGDEGTFDSIRCAWRAFCAERGIEA